VLFSSTLFLFAFLPLVLALYRAFGQRAKNSVLLQASLLFYAWGEAWLVGLMLGSILANYGLGLWVERARERGSVRLPLVVAVAFNLGLLFVFKYADWLWASLGSLMGIALQPLGGTLVSSEWGRNALLSSTQELRLPLGISFFTFQALSYVVDIARRDVAAQRSLRDFALYITFFPQLIAGPIVRYVDVAAQIMSRTESVPLFASGVRRFVVGLGKKVLIANTVGALATQVFSAPSEQVTAPVAWLAILAYTLQIYFDFSGYSDMAIGLGRMFGFRFIENFDYPYISRSVTEFWRRWHISLSTWFRDYLYIPMGGGRVSPLRVYFNLVTVFVLCGMWHGASWNYLLFGCFHGLMLVIERVGLAAQLERAPRVLRHAYVMFAVMIGWTFFSCEDFGLMRTWFAAMFGFADGRPELVYAALYLDPTRMLALIAGAIGALPWTRYVSDVLARSAAPGRVSPWPALAADLSLGLIVCLCALELTAGTFNPFIYFRF